MTILAWVLLGVLTGLVADALGNQLVARRYVHPGMGVLGAVIGGFGYLILARADLDFRIESMFTALFGAIVAVVAFKLVERSHPIA